MYRWMLCPLMGLWVEFCLQGKQRKQLQGCPWVAMVLWGRKEWAEVSLWGKHQGQLQYPGKCRARGGGDQWWCPAALLCADRSASNTCWGPAGVGQDGATSHAAAHQRDNSRPVFSGNCIVKGSSCSSLACEVFLFLYSFLRNNRVSSRQSPSLLMHILLAGQKSQVCNSANIKPLYIFSHYRFLVQQDIYGILHYLRIKI